MAYIEKRLPKEEYNKLVNQWVEEKKVRPSRINRQLTYKLYNQLFNGNQRDVNACTCLDRDTDYKVTRELERYLKLDPLPIESNVKIDFSSMTAGGDVLTVFGEEEEIVATPKRKRSVRSKKKTNEEEGSQTAD